MSRNRAVPAILLALAITLTACGDDDSTEPATTTSSTAAPNTTTGNTPTETTTGLPPGVSVPASDTTSYLTAVRAETAGDGIDKVTFKFEGSLPGYDVSYIEGPIRSDGQGSELPLAGTSVLRATFTQASGAKLEGGFVKTYHGPDRITPTGTDNVKELVKAGDFEARLTWGVGTQGQVPFTVTPVPANSEIVLTFGPQAAR